MSIHRHLSRDRNIDVLLQETNDKEVPASDLRLTPINETFRDALRREIGAKPSEETEMLYREILAGNFSTA